MKPRKTYKYKRTVIAAKMLTVDRAYQRDVIESHMRNIATNLDLDSLRTFSVSHRTDGNYYVIDGQHRWLALRENDLLDWEVDCDLYEGLEIDDEAALYRRLNASRVLSRFDKFKAGVVAGDNEATTIRDICARRGLTPNKSPGEGNIQCVAHLERIYRRHGGDVLDRAIKMATSVWGKTSTAVDGNIVSALASLLVRFGDTINWQDMEKALAKTPQGPAGIRGIANGTKTAFPLRPMEWCTARAIIQRYNIGRRTSKIEWRDDEAAA